MLLHLRPHIGRELELLYPGAQVRAGMGYAPCTQIADRLETSAGLLFVNGCNLA